MSAYDSVYDTSDAERVLNGPMTTMQAFLADKVKLPGNKAFLHIFHRALNRDL